MRNIVVVEAISTGVNFITDIVHRGYHPVALELKTEEESHITDGRKGIYSRTRDQFDVIKEQASYEETLALVKSYDPLLVLAGSEDGVVMATRLADDLGLPGNPAENLDQMTKKNAMHEALKKAGIRYIKGEVVNSPQEALDFCTKNKLTCAVVKPLQSAGSNGLFLCDNLEEVKNAVNELFKLKDYLGRPIQSALVQERIRGTEYIVNTMSSAGSHRLSSVLRYRKVKTTEGGYIYDNIEVIYRFEPGHTALIEYAFQVADAIGIQYGCIHGEYMIDEKGPVLIEVNCRPMGASQPAAFMDLTYGQHETDSILDCFLAPGKFAAQAAKPYRPLRQAYMKLIKVPAHMEAETLPIWTIAQNLRSTYMIDIADPMSIHDFAKTRDLISSGGLIYMVHDDKTIVDQDLQLLTKIEDQYFSYIFNDGMSRRWFADPKTPRIQVDYRKLVSGEGSTLIAAPSDSRIDPEIEGALIVSPDQISQVTDGFDQVIIALGQWLTGVNEVECLETIFRLMKKVKIGGKVIFPEETCKYLTYQREGAELLLQVLGYTIEAPLPGQDKAVIGSRY